MRSCITPKLPTHLLQEVNVGTVAISITGEVLISTSLYELFVSCRSPNRKEGPDADASQGPSTIGNGHRNTAFVPDTDFTQL